MSELINTVWTELYRPKDFDSLILKDKTTLLKYLSNEKSLPSFIFYSSKPGTGKTSCAKVISNYLNCDTITINSSSERGIDVIRDRILSFAMSLSSNDKKRCVFLDEADGLTRPAQDSLRNIIEAYSDNCFFIFSCNDINKIIEPIRSRCQIFNFESPSKENICLLLERICKEEEIEYESGKDLINILSIYYPDIRSMIKTLQKWKITGKNPLEVTEDFEMFLDAIERKDIDYIVKAVYSGKFDIIAWNKWAFNYFFTNYNKYTFDQISLISQKLADSEKSWNIGANLEVVFIANILEIGRVLK